MQILRVAPSTPRVYKGSHACSSGVGGVSLWTDSTLPQQLPAPEIKRLLLSTSLACSLAFDGQGAGPHTRLLGAGFLSQVLRSALCCSPVASQYSIRACSGLQRPRSSFKSHVGRSLLVQRLRLRLPAPGRRFNPWSGRGAKIRASRVDLGKLLNLLIDLSTRMAEPNAIR